ncbi:hypothetical protein CBR_g20100 [Chara braunii]|uniref:N-acetyl-D-glucosamine kinase n=1 Tax=Chara braunii TaxID=69332 RepID=A0A388KZI9_CHABU|nr:hypothetical protein CBR_g20100 [Chara braunii]|eukprot:GBG75469.1 hypothetical protein CBR_g20100 [Chara braunii]
MEEQQIQGDTFMPSVILPASAEAAALWFDDVKLASKWSWKDGPNVVLGIDGGATKTSCVAVAIHPSASENVYASDCDTMDRWTLDARGFEDGTLSQNLLVLGRGTSGSANHNSVGVAVARRSLEEAMASALQQAQLPRAAVRGICMGIAGVEPSAENEIIKSWVRSIFPGCIPVWVYNDAIVALSSGTNGKLYGCVLIVGTGTIAFGVNQSGAMAHASGWGPALGDKGSGHSIGTDALTAVARSLDGRGPPTSLTAAIMGHLRVSTAQELITWAYEDSSWARIAALVPLVKASAESGDAEALRIIDEAAAELLLSVRVTAEKLNLARGGSGKDAFQAGAYDGEDGAELSTGDGERSPHTAKGRTFPLVLVGGVLKEGIILERFLGRLQKEIPSAKAVKPIVDPAVGAAMLAMTNIQASGTMLIGPA